jgi:hypothetical protein
MITLKNLDQATPQQVFEQVAIHLLTQNAKSINQDYHCLYKNENGLKCAAGSLIHDDEYNNDFEDKQWSYVSINMGIRNHVDLITDLQNIHDSNQPNEWFDELTILGNEYNLNIEFLNQFK